jgi:PAS domain S-box-containing protein
MGELGPSIVGPDIGSADGADHALLAHSGISHQHFDALPVAAYATDADGFIVYFNDAAAALWGHRPPAGTVRWCGSHRLFRPGGAELPHDECPIAMAVREQRSVRAQEVVVERLDGYRLTVIQHASPLFGRSGACCGAQNLMIDISDLRRHEEQLTLLAREAEHRAKNVLASVTAIVHLSHAATADGLKRSIEGRIRILADAHALCTRSHWVGADVESLLALTLSPYSQDEARLRLAGPHVILRASLAQNIAMALHELATNAAKYGALSVPAGSVQVAWSQPIPGRLLVRWEECGGPPVTPPKRTGFGTRVMQAIVRQLDGEMLFDWNPGGLVCEIVLRL